MSYLADVRNEVRAAADHEHNGGCVCILFQDNGRRVARRWIELGLIPTTDHRGWADALTAVSQSLGQIVDGAPFPAEALLPLARQFAWAALTLDDLAPDAA